MKRSFHMKMVKCEFASDWGFNVGNVETHVYMHSLWEDSGYYRVGPASSNHMTGNIAIFYMLDENVKSQVTLGIDSKVFVMGKGDVNVLTK